MGQQQRSLPVCELLALNAVFRDGIRASCYIGVMISASRFMSFDNRSNTLDEARRGRQAVYTP